MYNNQQKIRNAVDGLRKDVKKGNITAKEAHSMLVGFNIRLNDKVILDDFHNGAIHMCPWNTCQATHHN